MWSLNLKVAYLKWNANERIVDELNDEDENVYIDLSMHREHLLLYVQRCYFIKHEEISWHGMLFLLHLPRKPFRYIPFFSLTPVDVPWSDWVSLSFFFYPNDFLPHVSHIALPPAAFETEIDRNFHIKRERFWRIGKEKSNKE